MPRCAADPVRLTTAPASPGDGGQWLLDNREIRRLMTPFDEENWSCTQRKLMLRGSCGAGPAPLVRCREDGIQTCMSRRACGIGCYVQGLARPARNKKADPDRRPRSSGQPLPGLEKVATPRFGAVCPFPPPGGQQSESLRCAKTVICCSVTTLGRPSPFTTDLLNLPAHGRRGVRAALPRPPLSLKPAARKIAALAAGLRRRGLAARNNHVLSHI